VPHKQRQNGETNKIWDPRSNVRSQDLLLGGFAEDRNTLSGDLDSGGKRRGARDESNKEEGKLHGF